MRTEMSTETSDLLEQTVARIVPLDEGAMRAAEERQMQLTKPPKALGRLETLSIQLAGITGDPTPVFADKVVAVMAGDHGVTAEGVSAFPAEVTPAMVANFAAGGAAINVIGRHVDARVVVTDVGVDADLSGLQTIRHRKVRRGTANMTQGPAMSRDEALRAVEVGIELVDEAVSEGTGMFATGEMGIGNTTAGSAVIAALTGCPVADVTGRGTGIARDLLPHKVAVIETALEVNRPDKDDPLDVLAKVGGLEIAAMAGVMLGCASRRVPVVMDGFISAAAALTAVRLCSVARDYILPSHVSIEVGHQKVLDELELTPLFDLQMRLGEGTGAALSMSILDAAAKTLAEMATFQSAGVAGDPSEADAELERGG
ncbi:MAG: nicotinate-nucleotide--dimethylbenzimidazole phosphoribosyltransferase [Actinobacteria bacterium]|nr:nicotinate-nucleotide--dimethylbenzimidazole phosphoribosyltransferase [Actinomycetota bacterium]